MPTSSTKHQNSSHLVSNHKIDKYDLYEFVKCSATNRNQDLFDVAKNMDKFDTLGPFRKRFNIPSGVYFCGNSLGPIPSQTYESMKKHLDKWSSLAVEGHFSGFCPWANIEDEPSELSMSIVGASFPHEIAIMNSLTINIHLMLTAFYKPVGKRTKILLEDHAFSSDEYALQTHLESRGFKKTEIDDNLVRLKPRPGEYSLREKDIIDSIEQLDDSGSLALVFLPGVQFYTGQVFPMEQISSFCSKRNITVGFDLAHAVGNIPLHLHDWNVDFAVWCNYKYLNSGPGAIAGLFLHDKHSDADICRHGGWWGHEKHTRFIMSREFHPQKGARGFQVSNPSVLSIIPLLESLKILKEAGGVQNTYRKTIKLTRFLRYCLTYKLDRSIEIITPNEIGCHGAQLSICVKKLTNQFSDNNQSLHNQFQQDSKYDGDENQINNSSNENNANKYTIEDVNNSLASRNVICDIRYPDVIRVAPAPLFNTFVEVFEFVEILESVLKEMKLFID